MASKQKQKQKQSQKQSQEASKQSQDSLNPLAGGVSLAGGSSRFARQIAVAEFGLRGQEVLAGSKIAIVGLGALGSNAAMSLAAAGVGTLTLIDHDQVEEVNLPQQLLYRRENLGQPKALAAQKALQDTKGLSIVKHVERLSDANAQAMLDKQDLIIDATDNFTSRYIINRAAIAHNTKLVSAALMRFEIRVLSLHPGTSACYACCFPAANIGDTSGDMSGEMAIPECDRVGILGPTAALGGVLIAHEAIRELTLLGNESSKESSNQSSSSFVSSSIAGRMAVLNLLDLSLFSVACPKSSTCPACGKSAS